MYLNIISFQDILGIHYDDLGLCNELLYFTIQLTKVSKDVI
jgi:hypothetical protein